MFDPATRYLSAFLAVCDEGGFRRAGEKLHLSQPAVSYQIRMLEAMLQVNVFERAGRGVILTEKGQLLREYCRRTFSDFAALRAQLHAGDRELRGTLRIASVSAFGRYVLFPIVAEQFPDVRVDLRFPTQSEVVRLVSSGVCDLGFIYESKTSSALHADVAAREDLVLVAGVSFRLPPLTTPEAIAALPFVTYEESEYVFGRWFEALFGRQPPSLTSVSHFEEIEEAVALVRRGRGVSILPDHSVRAAVDAGELRIIRPRGRPRCHNDIRSLVRPGAFLSADARQLLDTLRRS